MTSKSNNEQSNNEQRDLIKEVNSHSSEIRLIQGEFTTKLPLWFAPAVKAGYPTNAESYEIVDKMDFNHDLVPNPDTTFYARVCGDSMIGAGVNDGDIIVIDRSIEAKKGDIILAYLNHEYTLKYYDDTHKDDGYIELVPANDKYPRFKVTKDDFFMIWGVARYTIKNMQGKFK